MVRNLFMKVTAGLMVLACSQSFAGTNYWSAFNGKTPPSRHPMSVTTKDYTVFSLDQTAMKSFLSSVGEDPDQAQQIFIPTPDHKFMSFHIWRTPLMEKPLADKYPDIQTFTAVSDDNPAITAKVEYTMFGFSSMVYNGSNSFIMEAYNKDIDGYYVSYYKKDFYPSIEHQPCTISEAAHAGDNGALINGNEASGNTAQKVNGNTRRKYRLALSCTGEYAVNIGGANPSVAQIITYMSISVSRINGYYEREFSVSFDLIGSNDAIVFVNPTTDPYSCNNNLNCLIGEVGTVIPNVIGDANYDIGHIVCTAGGGLAQLNAVCGAGKSRGCSSSGNANDVSVMLHEMGHQFSATHTFSANSGGCNGNRSDETAYEPGGGITTMSYSGVCAENNIGGPNDDYFHVNSLMQVGNFLTTQGATCGTTEPGTNPVVIPTIKTDTFYIPRNTPFELTAPANLVKTTNPAQTVLLYNWEQFDALDAVAIPDPVEAQAAQFPKGPLFRSYDPTEDRVRFYPEYTNINAGTYGDGATGAGQRISKVARDINFKLSVRSIYQGWGTFNFTDYNIYLKTDPSVHDFRVTEPSVDETWNIGQPKTIKWDYPRDAPVDQDSVKCGQVNIYLSYDDGKTFPKLLVANAPNTGSYTVALPSWAQYSEEGRIKVQGSGNAFFDVSKSKLLINGTQTGIPKVNLAGNVSVYPNPASNQIIISNKAAGSAYKLIMYNVIGQQVWSGQVTTQTTINVAAFARGNYLIQMFNENTGERNTEKITLN